MSNVLGIDAGEKKIGLALGQTETRLAFPRPPILVNAWIEAWPSLQDLVEREAITTIVVGWPVNADGSLGVQTDAVEQFIIELQRHVSVPIVRYDERLTTQAVQREHRGRRLSRGQEDSLAAQLLLESYLASQP